tara:strand:- start:3423 stop:4217 length:795 start_codon:yes stop_codon:yes gene_type:complete
MRFLGSSKPDEFFTNITEEEDPEEILYIDSNTTMNEINQINEKRIFGKGELYVGRETPQSLYLHLVREQFIVHLDAGVDVNHLHLLNGCQLVLDSSFHLPLLESFTPRNIWLKGKLSFSDLLRHQSREVIDKLSETCLTVTGDIYHSLYTHPDTLMSIRESNFPCNIFVHLHIKPGCIANMPANFVITSRTRQRALTAILSVTSIDKRIWVGEEATKLFDKSNYKEENIFRTYDEFATKTMIEKRKFDIPTDSLPPRKRFCLTR